MSLVVKNSTKSMISNVDIVKPPILKWNTPEIGFAIDVMIESMEIVVIVYVKAQVLMWIALDVLIYSQYSIISVTAMLLKFP